MKSLVDIAQWQGRFVILASLIVLPFCRFLLQNHYDMLRPEALAAIATLAVSSSLLALIGARKPAFYILTLGVIVLMSALPAQRLVASVMTLKLTWFVLGIPALLLLPMLWMKERFFQVLLVFVISSFAVDIVQYLQTRSPEAVGGKADAPRETAHVLYLLLDEQMAPGGLPKDMEATRSAAARIEATFTCHNFRLYRNAHSNYSMTLDSISSLYNRSLLPGRRHYFGGQEEERLWGVYRLRENKVFADYAAQGYRIHVYQHRSIDYTADGVTIDKKVEYWDSLEALGEIDGPWTDKFRWLVGNYQRSDQFLARTAAFFPFRFGSRNVGPLALGRVWPEELARDIVEAKTKTFFAAHLMIPHRPYVFDRRGVARDFRIWNKDDIEPVTDPRAYADKYRRYAEQIEYLCGQLEGFFGYLRAAGVFDGMTVVVFGDHGSRIRLQPRAPAGGPTQSADQMTFDRYDYPAAPEPQDLLNRFSALLAVKERGALRPEIVEEHGSVLRFIEESVYRYAGDVPQGADSLYLFTDAGLPRRIPSPHIADTRRGKHTW